MNKKHKLLTLIGGLAAASLVLGGCSGSSGSSNDAAGSGSESGPASYLPYGDEISTKVDKSLTEMIPQEYKDKGVINIAVDIPFPPMAYIESVDGTDRALGVDAELGRLIGQKLGIKVSVNKQAFDSVIPSLQAGKNDIILSGMNDTKERQQTLSFVEYAYLGQVVLVRKGEEDAVKSIDDLCGKTVAVQKATTQGDALKAMDCGVTVMELPTDLDAQTALRAGKADAYFADAVVSEYAAATVDNGNAFSVVADPAYPQGYNPRYIGIGILKEKTELVDLMQKALQALIDEGTYQKVLERHGMEAYVVDAAEVNLGSD